MIKSCIRSVMVHTSRETKKQNFIRGWFQNDDADGSCCNVGCGSCDDGWLDTDGWSCGFGWDAIKWYVYRHSVHCANARSGSFILQRSKQVRCTHFELPLHIHGAIIGSLSLAASSSSSSSKQIRQHFRSLGCTTSCKCLSFAMYSWITVVLDGNVALLVSTGTTVIVSWCGPKKRSFAVFSFSKSKVGFIFASSHLE